MALNLISPEDETEDIGTDDYIRDLRKLWIEYADPLYIDLLDTDNVLTSKDIQTVDLDLDITIPEIIPIRPLIPEEVDE